MVKVKFGIHLPNGGFSDLPFSYIKKLAIEAEKLGYDSIWVADHLIYPQTPPNIYEALTTLAALSSITSQVTLGTSILLPLRHPLLLANMISTLDHASDGRVILGIGAGWYKPEFDASDIPYNQRGEVEEEEIRLLRLLWSKSDVNFQGRHFKAENLSINPKPLQKPHPKIWIGGGVEKTFRRIAKYGDAWLAWCPTLKICSYGISEIRSFCKALGREASEVEFAADFLACIKKDGELARKEAKKMNLNKEESIIGNPEECTERMGDYARLGVSNIIFSFEPYGQELESMKLTMEEIVPSI